MWDFGFSQWCCWWFESSKMLHSVDWYIVTYCCLILACLWTVTSRRLQSLVPASYTNPVLRAQYLVTVFLKVYCLSMFVSMKLHSFLSNLLYISIVKADVKLFLHVAWRTRGVKRCSTTYSVAIVWRWVVSFALWLLYPLGERVGSQSQSGHFGEEKNILPVLRSKLRIIQHVA